MSRSALFTDAREYANSPNDPQLTYEMPDISHPPKPNRPPPRAPPEEPIQPVPAHRKAPVPQTPKKSKPIFTIIIVVLLIIIIALLILFLVLSVTQGRGTDSGNLSSGAANNKDENPLNLAIVAGANEDTQPSCSAWKNQGFKTSGIYKVSGDPDAYYVYCDMTTADGGWNLVASVHVADIQTPCSSEDMWSRNPAYAPTTVSTQRVRQDMYGNIISENVMYGMPYSERVSSGSSNWWNKTTFGKLNAVTSADYKSEAYYTVPASDVMLVHVPNDTPLDKVDERSFLKYHTNDSFLSKYSSSLATFFGKHARLQSLSNLGINQGILKNLEGNTGLSSMIAGYQPVTYTANDFSNEDIIEHKVFFRFDDKPFQRLQFQTTYTDSMTYNIGSIKSQPFVAVASLSSLDGYPQKIEMKVIATTKHTGRRSTSSITFQYNSGNVRAWYLYIYNTNAPSGATYASIFFTYSKTSTSISGAYIPYTTSSSNLTSSVSYDMKSAGNSLFGYTFMIRRNSSNNGRINVETVKSIVRRIIATSGDIRDLKPPQSFIFPVVFDKNANVTLEKNGVDVGFLQFRAYDMFGHPYAICPAVSLAKSADPALFCIGSADTSRYSQLRGRCGDFSAWNKLPEHVIQDRNTVPGGIFVNDIHSSILIFTR